MRKRLETAVRTLGLCLVGLAAAGLVRADNSAAEIKAAFIYNFAKFVEWPRSAFPDERSPLQLCIRGAVLEGKLQLLNGREAQGHQIQIRNLGSGDDGQGCHILVIGDMSGTQRAQLLQSLSRSSVLTISENGSDFLAEGGMIGLFVAGNRVQFSVNLGAAQLAGLKMSARMLQLAHTVRGETP